MQTRTIRLATIAALLLAGVTLAGCETTGDGPAAQVAAPQPMTHQEAATECWMATEKTAARMDLDKRADVVDKCIEQRMSGAAPASADATTAAKPAAAVKPKPKT